MVDVNDLAEVELVDASSGRGSVAVHAGMGLASAGASFLLVGLLVVLLL